MPDFSGQFRVSDVWLTAGQADEVMARLAGVVGASPPTAGDPLETDVGSRVAMRALGFLAPVSKVPMRLTIEVVERAHGTQVIVQAVSNQGWYAMSASRFTSRTYERALSELLDALRLAAPPA